MSEATQFGNFFGTVTNKRITYFSKRGLFGGGTRQDVPMKHVTSIGVETKRNIIAGLFLCVIGVFLLPVVVGIIPLAFGVFALWGYPYVSINTAGTDITTTRGYPWHRDDAEQFAAAVRNELFRE